MATESVEIEIRNIPSLATNEKRKNVSIFIRKKILNVCCFYHHIARAWKIAYKSVGLYRIFWIWLTSCPRHHHIIIVRRRRWKWPMRITINFGIPLHSLAHSAHPLLRRFYQRLPISLIPLANRQKIGFLDRHTTTMAGRDETSQINFPTCHRRVTMLFIRQKFPNSGDITSSKTARRIWSHCKPGYVAFSRMRNCLKTRLKRPVLILCKSVLWLDGDPQIWQFHGVKSQIRSLHRMRLWARLISVFSLSFLTILFAVATKLQPNLPITILTKNDLSRVLLLPVAMCTFDIRSIRVSSTVSFCLRSLIAFSHTRARLLLTRDERMNDLGSGKGEENRRENNKRQQNERKSNIQIYAVGLGGSHPKAWQTTYQKKKKKNIRMMTSN